MGAPAETANVLAPPPLLYGGALGASLVAHRLAPLPWWPRAARVPVGLGLLAGGVALFAAAFRALAGAETPISPYEPTRALVQEGPYRFSRNPVYLAFSLVTAGAGALANSAWPLVGLALVTPVIRVGVIAREERYLERRLGAAYAAYRARVRRWL